MAASACPTFEAPGPGTFSPASDNYPDDPSQPTLHQLVLGWCHPPHSPVRTPLHRYQAMFRGVAAHLCIPSRLPCRTASRSQLDRFRRTSVHRWSQPGHMSQASPPSCPKCTILCTTAWQGRPRQDTARIVVLLYNQRFQHGRCRAGFVCPVLPRG
ncbi:hypothetical protein BC826DRAFT_132372 [Russula brevipes]|nr:hypothetical protein BC826DRAFT_132372 [Russula brevipes]